MNAAVLPLSRKKQVALWALRILMAALFLFAGVSKLTGQPMTVTEFQQVGLGEWFRYFTGTLEVGGAIALLIPRISIFGAIDLLLVDIGALVAQITVLHVDWIHPIVIGAILMILIYWQRSSVFGRI
jgi:putative oxidoreductase